MQIANVIYELRSDIYYWCNIVCECWWDLPRNIKKSFWPRYGLELCLGWRVSLCDKCPRRRKSGGQKSHNLNQSSFYPWRFLSQCKLWLMFMFQLGTWEWSLRGQGLDTVGWETLFGGTEMAWRHWIPINNIPATWSGLPQRPTCSL